MINTLLAQLYRQLDEPALIINFEHPLLLDFTVSDYSRLDNVIAQHGAKWLLLDEIQILPQWEVYVRQKLDQHYKIVITGSRKSRTSNRSSTAFSTTICTPNNGTT